MIDPDNITLVEQNTNNLIKFNHIPEFNFVIYDLEEEKEYRKYIKNIEKEVRGSYEYKTMVKFLKENMNMDKCAFINMGSEAAGDIKIEIHHYPFTLYDIAEIVYRKRVEYQESLDVQMVAKEITMLHYKLLVGLIPLSVTVHQLAHDGKVFIPIQNILGRYQLFLDFYKPYCTEEQLETLYRIEKYSNEQVSELFNSVEVLQQNNITYEFEDPRYQLPDLNNVSNIMNARIVDIQNNDYKLPTIHDKKEDLDRKDENRRTIISPLYFSKKE